MSENEINESVEHVSNLIDSKSKSVLSTTYSELKKLVDRVVNSSYWISNESNETETIVKQVENDTGNEDEQEQTQDNEQKTSQSKKI